MPGTTRRTPHPPAAQPTDSATTAADQAAFATGVARGRAQIDAGKVITGKEVSAWVESWGTNHERPRPTPKS